MLLLGQLMKVRELNALFQSKKCTLYFPYEQPVFKGDHATPLELESSVIFMIIKLFGFLFYLFHSIIRAISNGRKMSLQILLCQICRIEHCMGSVIAEPVIEHSVLDSKLGRAASKLEDKSRIMFKKGSKPQNLKNGRQFCEAKCEVSCFLYW